MRGVGAELDGGLIGGGAEVSEEVTNLLLAGVDDRSGGCGVDGGSHILTKLLEAAARLLAASSPAGGGPLPSAIARSRAPSYHGCSAKNSGKVAMA